MNLVLNQFLKFSLGLLYKYPNNSCPLQGKYLENYPVHAQIYYHNQHKQEKIKEIFINE